MYERDVTQLNVTTTGSSKKIQTAFAFLSLLISKRDMVSYIALIFLNVYSVHMLPRRSRSACTDEKREQDFKKLTVNER